MIKQIAVIRRRPGLTHQEFLDYIVFVHAELARANKTSLQKYLQNHVYDCAFGCAADNEYSIVFGRDSITELYFDSLEDMALEAVNPYTRDVLQPDGANFSEMAVALPLLVNEELVDVPHPSSGGVKVYSFLKAIDGLDAEEFRRRWAQAHTEILAEDTALAARLNRCVLNVPISMGNAEYFGSLDVLTYEGVVTLWFADAVSCRQYHDRLERASAGELPFYNPSLSFFLLCNEFLIFAH
jgi:hypothetical protein